MPLESMARMMESPLPRQSPSTPSLRITALKPDDADLLPSPRAGAICRSSRTRSSGATAVLEAAPAKAPMAMVVGTDAFSFFLPDIAAVLFPRAKRLLANTARYLITRNGARRPLAWCPLRGRTPSTGKDTFHGRHLPLCFPA